MAGWRWTVAKQGGLAALGAGGAPVAPPPAPLHSSIGRGNANSPLFAWVPVLEQGVLEHPCQHGNEQWKEELMREPGTSERTSEADAPAGNGEVEASTEPSAELDVNFDEQFFAA